MTTPEQQSGQDSSFDLLWLVALIVGGAYLSWVFGRAHIVSGIFQLRIYEGLAINYLFTMANKIIAWSYLVKLQLLLINTVLFMQHNLGNPELDFHTLAATSTVIGNFIKWPLVGLMLLSAAWLYFSGVEYKVRNIFNLKSLRVTEQDNWPLIKPILALDLAHQPLNQGPWAMARSPIEFCKKHQLLNVSSQDGKYVATIDQGAAVRVFALQLGPKWREVAGLPNYLKALFAIFAARIEEDRAGAEQLLDSIARASASGKQLSFNGTEQLLAKHQGSKKVAKIVQGHGYISTVLASLLLHSRAIGVLASSEFIWLKPLDRRLWYMLNSVGRQTAVAEIAGAFAHWLAERKVGMALQVPMVDEAVRGLELALSELLYKPESEE